MLEEVAAYLTLAPLVASVALGVLAIVLWVARRRPQPARVRVRHRR